MELAIPCAQIGDAVLHHGDCLQVMSAMPSESVDMVFADPPYNLSNDGTSVHAGKRVSVNKGIWDKSRGVSEDFDFHYSWIEACHRLLKPEGTIWISGTYHSIYACGHALQLQGWRILNDIAWYKPNAAPNLGCRMFTASHETLLWASKGKTAKHTFNYHDMRDGDFENDFIKKAGKQMRSVWSIATPGKSEKHYGKHPTQKPLRLLHRIILASTRPGNVILDPFCGSATTGVAALNVGGGGAKVHWHRIQSRIFGRTCCPPTSRRCPTAKRSCRIMERHVAVAKLRKLVGTDLHNLAKKHEVTVCKPNGKQNKGWAGHALERHLGLPLNSAQAPNFGSWELKVISLKRLQAGRLTFKETMAVTMIDPRNVALTPFDESHLLTKLRKAVLVARVVGEDFMAPSPVYSVATLDLEGEALSIVKQDYNLVREYIRDTCRGFDALSGKLGTYIQPRTKGPGHGSTSRAFYARKEFLRLYVNLNR